MLYIKALIVETPLLRRLGMTATYPLMRQAQLAYEIANLPERLMNMKKFKRICSFEHLAYLEHLLYDALKYDDAECSVSSSWKYYGMIQQELNSMYFREGLLTEAEYDILDAYLFDVICSDCYQNMMNRMEVRVEDER